MNAAKWSRLLTDEELQAEIRELTAKCRSPIYGKGPAGKLLRAAIHENRYRKRREQDSVLNKSRSEVTK